jgi:hypothetical protein
MWSTCPFSLSLSTIVTAATLLRGPHDSGGRALNICSSASESYRFQCTRQDFIFFARFLFEVHVDSVEKLLNLEHR